MPRSVARPRLERKAGVVDVGFLLSLCFAARLAWVVEVCGVEEEEEEEEEEETTLDEVDTVTSASIFGCL